MQAFIFLRQTKYWRTNSKICRTCRTHEISKSKVKCKAEENICNTTTKLNILSHPKQNSQLECTTHTSVHVICRNDIRECILFIACSPKQGKKERTWERSPFGNERSAKWNHFKLSITMVDSFKNTVFTLQLTMPKIIHSKHYTALCNRWVDCSFRNKTKQTKSLESSLCRQSFKNAYSHIVIYFQNLSFPKLTLAKLNILEFHSHQRRSYKNNRILESKQFI